jgi:hypothetical protein
MALVFNVFPYYVSSNLITHTPDKIAIAPKLSCPKLFSKFGILPKYLSSRYAFHYLYNVCWRIPRWCLQKYMHMAFHHFHSIYFKSIFLSYPIKYFFQVLRYSLTQYLFSILRYPYQVILQIIDGMFSPSYSHADFISIIASFGKPFLRLTANHFHPASKLTGIQWSLL